MDNHLTSRTLDGICILFSTILHKDVAIILPDTHSVGETIEEFLGYHEAMPKMQRWDTQRHDTPGCITFLKDTNMEAKKLSRVMFVHERDLKKLRGMLFSLFFILDPVDIKDMPNVQANARNCTTYNGKVVGITVCS